MKRSKTLAGYSVFVAKMREYEKSGYENTEAMKLAIRYCRENDILKEFFEKNGTEVMNMLMTEWNFDDALAVRFEEGLEKGMEQGIEKGMEQGIEKGMEQGIEKGIEKTARNALANGLSLELIQTITGLDMETIKHLQTESFH